MSRETYSAIHISPAPPVSWHDSSLLQNLYLATNLPIPVPGRGQVVVNIKASSLNARDLMVIAHDSVYPITTLPNLSPCSDGAGVVHAVGEGSKWAGEEGKKVVLCPSNGWLRKRKESGRSAGDEVLTMDELGGLGAGDVEGCLREFAVLDDEEILKAPQDLTCEELATLPTAAGTAYSSLFYGPQPLKAGQTLLTQGTDGVSCLAIQLASSIGCTVISTSSSASKLQIARSLGGSHTINYVSTPDWVVEVRQLTQGRGVDHVLDVGGASTILKSLRAVKQGSYVSVVGILGEGSEEGFVRERLFGGESFRGIFGATKAVWEGLLEMVEKVGVDGNRIRLRVERVFEWSEEGIKEAFLNCLGGSRQWGRLLLGLVVTDALTYGSGYGVGL